MAPFSFSSCRGLGDELQPTARRAERTSLSPPKTWAASFAQALSCNLISPLVRPLRHGRGKSSSSGEEAAAIGSWPQACSRKGGPILVFAVGRRPVRGFSRAEGQPLRGQRRGAARQRARESPAPQPYPILARSHLQLLSLPPRRGSLAVLSGRFPPLRPPLHPFPSDSLACPRPEAQRTD